MKKPTKNKPKRPAKKKLILSGELIRSFVEANITDDGLKDTTVLNLRIFINTNNKVNSIPYVFVGTKMKITTENKIITKIVPYHEKPSKK